MFEKCIYIRASAPLAASNINIKTGIKLHY